MAIKHIGLLDPTVTARVLDYVRYERLLQDEEWGDQSDHNPPQWMSILMEEVGEAAQETNRYWSGPQDEMEVAMRAMRTELIQVAAVAVAAIQFMEEAYELDGRRPLRLTEECSHHQGDAHEQH